MKTSSSTLDSRIAGGLLGLAGIYYGFEKIPKYYLENLAKATWIFKSAQLLQNVVSKQLNF